MQTENWNKKDKGRLIAALAIVADMQKNYGKEVNVGTMLAGFEMVLSDDCTVDQVLMALKNYIKTNSDIPTPADILKIITPEKPLTFTKAQYITAQKSLQAQCYRNPHSRESYVIRKYEEETRPTADDKVDYTDQITNVTNLKPRLLDRKGS